MKIVEATWVALAAAVLLPGCEASPGAGYLLEAGQDQVELCVGEVDVPDPALRALLESELPQPEPPEDVEEDPAPVILAEHLRNITGLRASNLGIKNLEGLECALRLETLGLAGNELTDLKPIENLTALRRLELSGNTLTQLDSLVGFDRLDTVNLDSNGITDLGPLAQLPLLRFIDLADNQISDVSPLSGLTELRGLVLSQNEITNITALAGLTELTAIRLDRNGISDIEALRGMTQLNYVDLDANTVTSLAALTDATELLELEASTNELTSLAGVSNKPQLIKITVNENMISSTEGVAGLAALTVLELGGNVVTALPGVETLASLRKLQLADNDVDDISAVTGLAELRELDVRRNPRLTRIDAVATLPLLGRFAAGSPDVALDLAPLAGRPVLSRLLYTAGGATDFAFLASLPALEAMDLSNTPLSTANIEQLTAVDRLQSLSINQTGVSDLGPLGANVLMEVLRARDNNLQGIAFVATWERVRELDLRENPLTSLVGMELLEVLNELDLRGTTIADLGPVSANETFRQGDRVLAADSGLDASDCAQIETIRARNATVDVDFECE